MTRNSPKSTGLLLFGVFVATAGAAGASSARDTLPPTVPNAFTAKTLDESAVRLNWEQSSDNFGVERYHLMRNGAVIARTKDLSYVDTGLEAGIRYTYDVMADDGENYSYVSRIVVTLPYRRSSTTQD